MTRQRNYLSRSRNCAATYRTWRFSQLLDLESRAHTRPSSPFTFRLAEVREPRYFRGLLWALPGGVSTNPPPATGVPETGVLGLVPPPIPERQMAPPRGEQARRLDLRIERFRKRSLDFSGFSSFNRICESSPTNSSSTL